jgi:hypothetical protein
MTRAKALARASRVLPGPGVADQALPQKSRYSRGRVSRKPPWSLVVVLGEASWGPVNFNRTMSVGST